MSWYVDISVPLPANAAALGDGHLTTITPRRLHAVLCTRNCRLDAGTTLSRVNITRSLAHLLIVKCIAVQVRQQAEALIDARKMIVNGEPLCRLTTWLAHPGHLTQCPACSLCVQARWTSLAARPRP